MHPSHAPKSLAGVVSCKRGWSTCPSIRREDNVSLEVTNTWGTRRRWKTVHWAAKEFVYAQEQVTGLPLSEPEIAELLLTFASLRGKKKKKEKKELFLKTVPNQNNIPAPVFYSMRAGFTSPGSYHLHGKNKKSTVLTNNNGCRERVFGSSSQAGRREGMQWRRGMQRSAWPTTLTAPCIVGHPIILIMTIICLIGIPKKRQKTSVCIN